MTWKTNLPGGLLLALLMMASLAAEARAQAEHETHRSEVAAEQPDVVVHVKGLACGLCARSVTNELTKLDAVDEVQVLLEEDQRVLLTLKEHQTVTEEALREAVANAGFTTREVVFADDEARPKKGDTRH
jgi:copper chaperone CopZ